MSDNKKSTDTPTKDETPAKALQIPVEPEHADYETDVPNVENLTPDFSAEDTDEVDETVESDEPADTENTNETNEVSPTEKG